MIKKYNWDEIQKFYDNGNSNIDIIKKYGCSPRTIEKAIKKGRFARRSPSEAAKLARKRYPVKHTEESKEKLRLCQFENLKKRNGKSPWERRNNGEMSGLEKWFYDYVIIKNNLQEKYDIIYNYPIYPYFTDFAFINLKLDVELDGKWHLIPDRQIHDAKKNKKLLEEGWTVYRIPHNGNNEQSVKDFLDFLDGFCLPEKVYPPTVIKYESKQFSKKYIKKGRQHDRLNKRKCIWPTADELENLSKEMTNYKIGKLFGVSHGTVKKWKKKYDRLKNIIKAQ